MKTLRECLAEAREKKVAIGHFNISNLETLWAIFNAARKLSLPVIIGVSEGERDFIGVRQVAALVRSLREEFDYPIFLNADHTYSAERVKEAIDAHFDAAIFDGAQLSYEENVAMAKDCVAYARAKNPEIIVEGELGYIGTSSKLLDELPEGVATGDDLTKPEMAAKFVEETGVDLLAPAVGNVHGMLKGHPDPALNISRVQEISRAVNTPLVLHGASGNQDEEIKAAIAAGVAIVHVNTELRVAYRDALKIALQENPDEVTPHKLMKPVIAAVEAVVEKKLKVFNNIAKI